MAVFRRRMRSSSTRTTRRRFYVRVTFGLWRPTTPGRRLAGSANARSVFQESKIRPTSSRPPGALVGGTFSGIAVSRNGGCDWSFAGNAGKLLVSDIAMRPDGSIVGIVVDLTSKAGADGGLLYDNRVLVSKDDAKTFDNAGAPLDPTMLLESVEVAATDPGRLYISSALSAAEGATRTASFSRLGERRHVMGRVEDRPSSRRDGGLHRERRSEECRSRLRPHLRPARSEDAAPRQRRRRQDVEEGLRLGVADPRICARR